VEREDRPVTAVEQPHAAPLRSREATDGAIDVEIALAALSAALTGAVYAGYYAGVAFVLPVVGAAVVPAALAVRARRRRWRGRIGLWLGQGALALFAVLTVYWPETNGGLPGPAAWSALVRGATDGWAQMLTVGLPADARGDLLVTPVLLTGLASALAAWLVVATASPLAPLAPVAGAFVVGLGLCAAAGGAHLPATALLLLSGLALGLVRTGRLAAAGVERASPAALEPEADDDLEPAPTAEPVGSSPSGRRWTGRGQLAFGLPLVVAMAVVGTLAAAVLPLARGHRLDPRDLRDVPLDVDDTLNPLVALKSQISTQNPADQFTVRADGLPDGVDRIRIASLDAYDGAQWTSRSEYRRSGATLPPDPLLVGTPAPAAAVRQHITIEGLRGPFLPVIGRPVEVDADDDDDVGFDPASGTLVSGERSLAGTSYDVVGAVGPLPELADAEQLPGLRAASAPSLDPYRAPPADVPPALVQLAVDWTRQSPDYVSQLLAIRDQLRQVRYDDSADAPPGHSFGALLRMLHGDPDEREGYAEQFAAAFALLARERGFASRVVVGYRLRDPDSRGTYHVTEADAHAWPEVDLEGLGWVVVEPTDLAKIDAQDDSPDDASDLPPEAPGNDGEDQEAEEPRVITDDAGVTTGSQGGGLRDGAALSGLVLLAMVAAVPLTAAAAKLGRRRRRRTAGDPATRVVGAWHETVDRLTEHGVPVDAAHTTIEVADDAAARFNGSLTAVGPLATLVAVAVFAADEPPDATADHAWELERTARRELGAIGGLSRRVWSLIDPRPLVRSWRRNVRSRPRAGDETRHERSLAGG
jgi:transglutaminase-like putative cysteine protease